MLILCYYIVVDVIIVVHPMIVFRAVALVVDSISVTVLPSVTMVDYSRYILLSMVRVV